jgi:nucleoside-diphosphate-sugar epimerase
MTTLICFGLGYCAEHFVAAFGNRFDRIVGTVRGLERAEMLNARFAPRLQTMVFDGNLAAPELRNTIGKADAALVSVPPDQAGDPTLTVCGAFLARASHLRRIVYLSTVGVYGDRAGGWVDEGMLPKPGSPRSRDRIAAEWAWQKLGARCGAGVSILRLAGIYGPGRNAIVQITRGSARCIVKPGQVFNRIHVGDVAQAIDAAFARNAAGIFNVADDEPSPPGDPIVFAAQLMGVEAPPKISFEEAAPSMSPMGLSFWQECRRVRNDKLKRELGVTLLYPTYREGLRALLNASSGP